MLFFKMMHQRKDKPGDYSVFDSCAALRTRVSSFVLEKKLTHRKDLKKTMRFVDFPGLHLILIQVE